MPMFDQGAGDTLTYSYRPSLLGATWSFTLAGDGLHWDNGQRAGLIPYDAIRRVRLSYRPGSMQAHRFMTEIWWKGGPKLTIVSVTWRSMTEVARLDREYRDFVLALHRRLTTVAQPIKFIGGTHPVLFWGGIVIFAGTALGLAVVAVRAVQQSAGVAALLIAGFFALFLWQVGSFFRRNRPVRYAATGVPADLVPKG